RDIRWEDSVAIQETWCPGEAMSSEDPLFLMYTSGSTGKPKGLLHTQAGYLLMVAMTMIHIFGCRTGEDHRFACTSDIGWITGHSSGVYGPLSVGATTVLFEGVPTYPHVGRYWSLVDRYRITHFYTAPTAIRTLKKWGDEPVKQYALDSLRLLGSVG